MKTRIWAQSIHRWCHVFYRHYTVQSVFTSNWSVKEITKCLLAVLAVLLTFFIKASGHMGTHTHTHKSDQIVNAQASSDYHFSWETWLHSGLIFSGIEAVCYYPLTCWSFRTNKSRIWCLNTLHVTVRRQSLCSCSYTVALCLSELDVYRLLLHSPLLLVFSPIFCFVFWKSSRIRKMRTDVLFRHRCFSPPSWVWRLNLSNRRCRFWVFGRMNCKSSCFSVGLFFFVCLFF